MVSLRPRACLRSLRPAGCRARSATGVTWTCRTANAGWAGRFGHTSVVDAAGALYVIGGYDGFTYFDDVWVSTDGGARAGLRREGTRGGTGWVLRDTAGELEGCSRGTMGPQMVPTGYWGYLGGT